jgi:hypothetical protein
MHLSRTYATRAEIPKGAEPLYQRTGALFIMRGAKRDIDLANPWEPGNWNLTDQGRFLAAHGHELANAFAAMAGTTVGALRPNLQWKRDLQVLIQRRDITVGNGSSSGGNDNALATGLATKV